MKLKRYRYAAILCIIAVTVWACNKSGDDAPVVGQTSRLNVINAVTDIRAIDFYLNGVRQNTNSAIYLFNTSGYVSVPTGEQQYQFKNDTLERAVLADIKLNPAKADSSYTMILAGSSRYLVTALKPLLANAVTPLATTSTFTVRADALINRTLPFPCFGAASVSVTNIDVRVFSATNPVINTVYRVFWRKAVSFEKRIKLVCAERISKGVASEFRYRYPEGVP